MSSKHIGKIAPNIYVCPDSPRFVQVPRCSRLCNHNERISHSPEVSSRKHEDEAIPSNPSASAEENSFTGSLIDIGLYSLKLLYN